MPKRNEVQRKFIGKPIRFSGRFVYSVATTAFTALDLHPTILDDRVINVALLYELWRPLSLKVRMNTREVTMAYCAGKFAGSETNAPATAEQIEDYPFFQLGTGLYGSALPSFEVHERHFNKNSVVKWYECDLSSLDEIFEAPFTVYSYAPFATLNHSVCLEYEFEFLNPADPNVVAMRMDRQRLLRTREGPQPMICSVKAARAAYKAVEGETKERVETGVGVSRSSAPAEGALVESRVLPKQASTTHSENDEGPYILLPSSSLPSMSGFSTVSAPAGSALKTQGAAVRGLK